MTHWLVPANIKFYDVFAAFEQPETFWPMNGKMADGDDVFIYLAAPYKQIGFVCEVLATGFALDEIIDQVRPFLKGKPSDKGPSKPFMKLKTNRSLPIGVGSVLSLQNLKANGLNGMLMGARKLENNPALFQYIREHSS